VTDRLLRARLVNAGGELIAEGMCWLNEAVGQATLEPEREMGLLEKERGALRLELDSGRTLRVSDKALILRLRPRGSGADHSGRRRLYRLWLVDAQEPNQAQEATAAGAAEEGSTAVLQGKGVPRFGGETPAAR
jgi:hypothetical protein